MHVSCCCILLDHNQVAHWTPWSSSNSVYCHFEWQRTNVCMWHLLLDSVRLVSTKAADHRACCWFQWSRHYFYQLLPSFNQWRILQVIHLLNEVWQFWLVNFWKFDKTNSTSAKKHISLRTSSFAKYFRKRATSLSLFRLPLTLSKLAMNPKLLQVVEQNILPIALQNTAETDKHWDHFSSHFL